MKTTIQTLLFNLLLICIVLMMTAINQRVWADIYFPHVASDTMWETEICLINTSSSESVAGTLRAYSNNGSSELETLAITLSPNQRRQITVGNEMTSPASIGYFVFDSDDSSLVGYTKFFQVGVSRVAIPAVSTTDYSHIYIPHVASGDGWWTGLSLVNTTASPVNLSVTFNTGESRQISLAGKEHKVFTVAGLFGVASKPDIQSGIISNANGVIGLELFGNATQLSGVVLHGELHKQTTVSHVASSGGWWTGIVAYNPSTTTAANLTIQPYTAAGAPLAVRSQSVAAGQKYIGTPATLGLPNGTEWLSITSSAEISSMELFGTNDGKQLAGYSLVGIKSKSGVFAKLEDQGWTGIAFVNPNPATATILLTANDNSGNPIATRSITLPAYAKTVGAPGTLLNSPNLVTATSITYSSDLDLVGFQLNGDNAGWLLDALPGMGGGSASNSKSLPQDIATNVDYIMSLLGTIEELSGEQSGALVGELGTLLETAMGVLMVAALADPAELNCPVITSSPAEIDISDLPSVISITVDFGQGCMISDNDDADEGEVGESVFSGRVAINISNLIFNASGISADFQITGTNLMQDDILLLDGTVSGSLAVSIGADESYDVDLSIDFSSLQAAGVIFEGEIIVSVDNFSLNETSLAGDVTVDFNNFSTGGSTTDGQIGIIISSVNGDPETAVGTVTFSNFVTGSSVFSGQVEITASGVGDDPATAVYTATFNNFRADDYTVNSGTLDVSMPDSETFLVVADLESTAGEVDLSLSAAGLRVSTTGEIDVNAITINTTETGLFSGYGIDISNLTFDPSVCVSYPSRGAITLNKGLETYIMTFTDSCDGSYIVTQP